LQDQYEVEFDFHLMKIEKCNNAILHLLLITKSCI